MACDQVGLQRSIIEDKLESLQQAVSFLYQDYNYHHKNNEFEILKRKLSRLLKANENLKNTLNAYDELYSKLEEAKQKNSEALEFLNKIKNEDSNCSDDDDKEN